MNTSLVCYACGHPRMEIFHRQQGVPVNSCILLDSRAEAVAFPQGDIDLAYCSACGFISNVAFDRTLTEYSGRYEETQGFSGTFNKFHRNLAERLIESHGLRQKHIVEIGCGKGEFLQLICDLGGNSGVGFDPGFREDRFKANGNIRVIKDFYSEKYSDFDADFVCCKMTLEHIDDTGSFVRSVRSSIGDRPKTDVFFQIPEAMRILKSCAFEDIYYEHCSYFTPGSLARLFRKAGFDVLKLDTEYADQYLTIEARPRADGALPAPPLANEESAGAVAALVADFRIRMADKLSHWDEVVRSAAARGERVALWGSGSKAVSFLTTLSLGDEVAAVVDINPHRQRHFMPVTGHEILAPADLIKTRPDIVVIMNSVYRDEISADLSKMGLAPTIMTLD